AMFLAGVKYRLGYGITGGSFMLTHQAPYMDTMHETSRNMALLKPLGVKSQTPEIKLYLSGEDAREADLLLKETDVEGEYAVLHAVPGHFTKNWEAGSFAQVARYLQDKKKLKPVMVGGDDDRGETPGIIDLSGKTSLTVLGQVLSRASIFIGVDSAPAHIAAAANIPTVVLFSGVNDPEQWAPKGGNVRIIYPGKGKDLSGVDAEEACRVIDEVIGSR
ncbi:MAG: glycosyltransferase family 9 protein, partial [Candidatus Omnitrophota bacterium]